MKSKLSRPAAAALLLAGSVLGASTLPGQRPPATDSAAGASAPAGPRGAAASVLDSTNAPFRRSPTLSDALSARAPGLSVWRSSGAVAAGSRLYMRTPTSLLGGGEPLVVVDGVLVQSAQLSGGVSGADVRTSRLDDLDPDDIASVEVLRGPAAAAMYGSGASGGALVITTRRGVAGPTRWQAFVDGGSNAAVALPSNYGRPGFTNAGGSPSNLVSCSLVLEARGACTPSALIRVPAAEIGRSSGPSARVAAGASASGGGGTLEYFTAAKAERDAGHYDANGTRRIHLRANVVAHPRSRLDLAATTAFSGGDVDLPFESGLLRRAITAASTSSALDPAYYPESYFSTRTRQDVRRWGGSLSARLRLTSWLTADALQGVDRVRQDDALAIPTVDLGSSNGGSSPSLHLTGSTESASRRTQVGTSRLDLTARFALPGRVGSQTSLGFVGERASYDQGRSASFGSSSGDTYYDIGCGCYAQIDRAAWRWLGASARATSYFARQRLAWRERVQVGGGVIRSEDRPAQARTYPFADASWELGQERLFSPVRRWIGGLRLRAAHGEMGRGAQFGAALGGELRPYIMSSGARPPRPERTAETEAGLDVSSTGERVTLAVTAYRRSSRDLLMARSFQTSGGSSTVLLQGAGLTGRGTEVELGIRLADRPGLRWDATVGGSLTSNRVSSLPVASYTVTDFENGVSQLFRAGEPLGTAFGTSYDYADRNGDGIIALDEVTVWSATSGVLGSPLPTRELMLRSQVTARRLSLFGALDYRGGHRKFDRTEWERCSGVRAPTCRGAFDPSAPLAEQAAVAASSLGYSAGFRSSAGFVEDASFLRLRELGATLALPERWAGVVGAHGATLQLTGRNLATWTRYRGLDPELWGAGTLGFIDDYAQPTMRLYTLRVTVTR